MVEGQRIRGLRVRQLHRAGTFQAEAIETGTRELVDSAARSLPLDECPC